MVEKDTAQLIRMLVNPRFEPQHRIKPGVLGHTCNFSTWEVEAGGSRVQGYPQQTRFKATPRLQVTQKEKERGGKTQNSKLLGRWLSGFRHLSCKPDNPTSEPWNPHKSQM